MGHLQNLFQENVDIVTRIQKAEAVALSPLRLQATLLNGDVKTGFAVNEVHVCNLHRGAGIYLRVFIDGKERVPRLGADGLIVATTIGSTGYNKSARGPILPLGDDLLAITPNNAYMPDRMRSSVIRPFPIAIEVIEAQYRPADVYADSNHVGTCVQRVDIALDTDNPYKLLYDPGHGLDEKIMRTQFYPDAPTPA